MNTYAIEEITLAQGFEPYSVAGESAGPARLDQLGRINILVGENNSGKSRLLRGLAKTQHLPFETHERFRYCGIPVRSWRELIDALKQDLLKRLSELSVHGVNDVDRQLNELSSLHSFAGLTIGKSVLGPLFAFLESQEASAVHRYVSGSFVYRDRNDRVEAALNEWAREALKVMKGLREIDELGDSFRYVYIPTLRSLRKLEGEDSLLKRTLQDYLLPEHVSVFTGQSLYAEVESLLRGTLADREKLREFEVWLSESFFRGRPVALIPRSNHDTLTVKIGDEEEKAVHELGDGVQSVLILTFPLFKNADRHVLGFIEEPELFLHPWLQRVVLEVLASKFPKHQYFLTTHSNHFLDMTLDVDNVSVFALEKALVDSGGKEKPAKFTITPRSRDDRKPLELLGVRNSSVLLSNCTIWVEGITDRRYISHWLTLYDKHRLDDASELERSQRTFREDLHYSFVEYGGGNITHFSFLDEDDRDGIDVNRLCGKLFLITDQDGAEGGTAKAARQKTLEERLMDRYFLLPGREIENLLPPGVLAAILNSYGEDVSATCIGSHCAYLNERLGTFIESKVFGDDRRRVRKGSYSEASGTISSKVEFCKRAIAATSDWSQLSKQAQELTERIFNFIAAQNSDR